MVKEIFKTIKKTLIYTTITLIFGILAILSDITTIFNFDFKPYLMNYKIQIFISYIFVNLFLYCFYITKKLIMIANEMTILHSENEIDELKLELSSKDSEIKKLMEINSNLAQEIDKSKDQKSYIDHGNIENQIYAVRGILNNMSEIEVILGEISRYDVIKRKHNDNYIRIKDDYFRDIPTIELFYSKYLKETRNSSNRALKHIFECSAIDDIVEKICEEYSNEESYRKYNIDIKKIKKFMSYFKDPLTKYLSYLESN